MPYALRLTPSPLRLTPSTLYLPPYALPCGLTTGTISMLTRGISEIKNELHELNSAQLTELCLQLARYKKDNKAFLGYLLFEAHDPNSYTGKIKNEIAELFASISNRNLYFAKKSFRKILNITNKHIRYTGSKQVEADLLIFFCRQMLQTGISFQNSAVINNLYKAQLKKITTAVAGMHEDLQYDYLKELKTL